MVRTAEKVRELVEEDAEMADAIGVVLERSADEDATIQWSDVSDSLTSGQWGRLIETGLLVDEAEGFRVADPEGVRAALSGSPESDVGESVPDEEPESTTWSTWDKVAGLLALGMFTGYYVGDVRAVVGSALNVVFGPLNSLLPFYAVILVLAVFTGLYSTLLQANLMDMEKMSYYQNKMSEIREREQAAKERGDEAELERIREEQMSAMGDNLGMFKEQFRPMAWIMLLTIPVFLWMYWKILPGAAGSGDIGSVVLPMVGQVGWTQGAIGPFPAWILWYFLCSVSFSQVVRKALNVQTTPT